MEVDFFLVVSLYRLWCRMGSGGGGEGVRIGREFMVVMMLGERTGLQIDGAF